MVWKSFSAENEKEWAWAKEKSTLGKFVCIEKYYLGVFYIPYNILINLHFFIEKKHGFWQSSREDLFLFLPHIRIQYTYNNSTASLTSFDNSRYISGVSTNEWNSYRNDIGVAFYYRKKFINQMIYIMNKLMAAMKFCKYG